MTARASRARSRAPSKALSNRIILGDNLEALRQFRDDTFPLIYLDPPFNTRRRQTRTRLRTVRDRNGDRTGFGGNRYRTVRGERPASRTGATTTSGFSNHASWKRVAC